MAETETRFWDSRYASGGGSGTQSSGPQGEWKWSVIYRYAPKPLTDVVDYGCGDLRFMALGGRLPARYVGIDASPEIVKRNRAAHPEARFTLPDRGVDALKPASVVLCIDVLFHVSEDAEYVRILRRLNRLTTGFLFVHTWKRNPLDRWYGYELLRRAWKQKAPTLALKGAGRILNPGTRYEKACLFYRRFEDYISEMPDLELVEVVDNVNKAGAMYVFRRRSH